MGFKTSHSKPVKIYTIFDISLGQPIMPWRTDLDDVLKVMHSLRSAKQDYMLMELEGRGFYDVEVYDIKAYGKYTEAK